MILIFVFLLLVTNTVGELRFSCPNGSIPYTGSNKQFCYTFNNQIENFDNAEYVCQTQGGHLAIVNDQFTTNFLAYNAKKYFSNQTYYWIGAKAQNVSKFTTWIWNQYNSILTYTDWAINSPSNTSPQLGYCTLSSVTDGTWSSQLCQTGFPFVCQVPSLISEYTCESGWTYFDKTGYCYKVYPQKDIVHDSAKINCRNRNAELISIHSNDENNFLAELTSIKTHENYHDIGIWIGLYRSNDEWYWTDGTNVDYTNWGKDDPDSGDCVLYYPDGCDGWDCPDYIKQWDTYSCDTKVSRYACKKQPSYIPYNSTKNVQNETKNLKINTKNHPRNN